MTEDRTFGTGTNDEHVGDDNIDDVTIYSDMRKELAEDSDVAEIPLKVDARPNFEVIYQPTIEYDLLRRTALANRRGKGRVFDELGFAYAILAQTCRGIRYKGNRMTDENGEELVFPHSDLRNMLGADSTKECIRKMYGEVDGHIISTSQKILELAGYGDYEPEIGFDDQPVDKGPFRTLVERLKSDERLKTAAAVGTEFKIDPVEALKSDVFDWAVRMAAYEYVMAQRETENARRQAAASAATRR